MADSSTACHHRGCSPSPDQCETQRCPGFCGFHGGRDQACTGLSLAPRRKALGLLKLALHLLGGGVSSLQLSALCPSGPPHWSPSLGRPPGGLTLRGAAEAMLTSRTRRTPHPRPVSKWNGGRASGGRLGRPGGPGWQPAGQSASVPRPVGCKVRGLDTPWPESPLSGPSTPELSAARGAQGPAGCAGGEDSWSFGNGLLWEAALCPFLPLPAPLPSAPPVSARSAVPCWVPDALAGSGEVRETPRNHTECWPGSSHARHSAGCWADGTGRQGDPGPLFAPRAERECEDPPFLSGLGRLREKQLSLCEPVPGPRPPLASRPASLPGSRSRRLPRCRAKPPGAPASSSQDCAWALTRLCYLVGIKPGLYRHVI